MPDGSSTPQGAEGENIVEPVNPPKRTDTPVPTPGASAPGAADPLPNPISISEAAEIIGLEDALREEARANDGDEESVEAELAEAYPEEYPQARTGRTLLGALGHRMAAVIARRTSEESSTTGPGDNQDAREANIDALLAEVEDDGSLAEKIKQQKEDIEKAHNFVSVYNERLPAPGTRANRRQQSELQSIRDRAFGETLPTPSELANEPDRLAAILDSVLCAKDIPQHAKDEVVKLITARVAKEVEKTAATVHPDIIWKRLLASFRPGFAQEQLQQVFIRKYFSSAENGSTKNVLDNYERFVRGIVRVVDHPQVTMNALNIAEFKTDLLPESSLYRSRVKRIPGIRLDKPELLGQIVAIEKALTAIYDHAHTVHHIPLPENEYTHSGNGFAALEAAEKEQVQNILGDAEIQKRLEYLSNYTEILTDQDKLYEGADRILGIDSPVWIRGPEVVMYAEPIAAQLTIEKYPDSNDFLTTMMDQGSGIIEDLDAHFDVGAGMKAEIRTADDSPSKVISWPTGDGFVIETEADASSSGFTEEVWNNIKANYANLIDDAKAVINSISGLRKRHAAFPLPNIGVWFDLRPENAEDRKPYHPIDVLLRNDSSDQTEQESNADIEAARNMVAEERNRFFNERGIVVIYDSVEDSSSRAIELRKHPRNPKALIVTVRDTAPDGTKKEARILMDPDLRFQLGSKKVRSPQALLALNAQVADIVAAYRCQIPLETAEGTLGIGRNTIQDRIAHLRILGPGENYGEKQWLDCVEKEGDDLDVLAVLERAKRVAEGRVEAATRNFTYVNAIETDDPSKGPLRIFLDSAS